MPRRQWGLARQAILFHVSSRASEPTWRGARQDTWKKARLPCETLLTKRDCPRYVGQHYTPATNFRKRNIFQISKLVLFWRLNVASKYIVRTRHSDPYQSRHQFHLAPVLVVQNPRSEFEIPAQHLLIPQQTCYYVNIFCCGSMTFC
jgi:hypothetical protein